MKELKVWQRIGYLHSFKVLFQEIVSNYKDEKNYFTMEKPSSYHLNQAIKMNIICNPTN